MAKYCVDAAVRDIRKQISTFDRIAAPDQQEAFDAELLKIIESRPGLIRKLTGQHHIGPAGPVEKTNADESADSVVSTECQSPAAEPKAEVATKTTKAKSKGALFEDPVDAPPVPSRMKPVDEDFEKFWKVFPRRVNKSKAKEAFERAFRKLRAKHAADECVRIIVDGAKVYAARANPDVLCHPTTWLNGERWDDDPEGIWVGEKPRGSAGVMLGKFNPESANLSFEEQQRLM